VPILANITEFGHTPLYTRDELATVGVDIVLHCCFGLPRHECGSPCHLPGYPCDGTQKKRARLDADAARICTDISTTRL